MLLRRNRFQQTYPQAHSFQHLAAQHLLGQNTNLNSLHMFDINGNKQSIDSLLNSNSERWNVSLSNEKSRLAQGIRGVKGNTAIDFVF